MPVTLRGFGAESVFLSLYKITETPLWLQGGDAFPLLKGGGPRVVVINTAFHARARGSFPSLGSLKETQMFLPHPLIKLSIVGSLRHREVACLASELQSLDFKSCVLRTVSSHLSHHAQEVLLAQFSLYVHKSGLKPDSFHFPLVKSSWRYCNSGSFFCCRRCCCRYWCCFRRHLCRQNCCRRCRCHCSYCCCRCCCPRRRCCRRHCCCCRCCRCRFCRRCCCCCRRCCCCCRRCCRCLFCRLCSCCWDRAIVCLVTAIVSRPQTQAESEIASFLACFFYQDQRICVCCCT